MSFSFGFDDSFSDNFAAKIGSSSAMPILVPPFDYADSPYPPRQSTSTELSPALGALSFGGYDAEAASTAAETTPPAEFTIATDYDRDMAAWRELWDLPKPAAEAGGDLDNSLVPPSVDRRFSNSEASDFESLPELASDYSTSPDQSPASLYETCSTPPQECVNAVCDVPLLAPRPLPCIPPSLFQFDFLPNERDDDSSRIPHSQFQRSKEHGFGLRKRRRSPSPPPVILARPMPHVARSAIPLHVAPPPMHDAKRRKAFVMPAVETRAHYPQVRHVDVPFAQAQHAPHAERFIMPRAGSDYRTTVGWV